MLCKHYELECVAKHDMYSPVALVSLCSNTYIIRWQMPDLHSQKRASCSKSAITKPISGCVRIACSGLMITSLLQVVNKLAASCELHTGLMQVVSSTAASLQISSCSKSDVHRCNLMKSTGLIQLVGKLHQAGKIYNLHQVCGVFCCV